MSSVAFAYFSHPLFASIDENKNTTKNIVNSVCYKNDIFIYNVYYEMFYRFAINMTLFMSFVIMNVHFIYRAFSLNIVDYCAFQALLIFTYFITLVNLYEMPDEFYEKIM